MMSKLKEISGSTIDLPPLEQVEQKFSGRNRLYIGNLTNDVSEEEILELFNPYGETSELFINKEKNFAFIRIVSTFCFLTPPPYIMPRFMFYLIEQVKCQNRGKVNSIIGSSLVL